MPSFNEPELLKVLREVKNSSTGTARPS